MRGSQRNIKNQVQNMQKGTFYSKHFSHVMWNFLLLSNLQKGFRLLKQQTINCQFYQHWQQTGWGIYLKKLTTLKMWIFTPTDYKKPQNGISSEQTWSSKSFWYYCSVKSVFSLSDIKDIWQKNNTLNLKLQILKVANLLYFSGKPRA